MVKLKCFIFFEAQLERFLQGTAVNGQPDGKYYGGNGKG